MASTAKLDTLKNYEGTVIYPKTIEKAIYDDAGNRLDKKTSSALYIIKINQGQIEELSKISNLYDLQGNIIYPITKSECIEDLIANKIKIDSIDGMTANNVQLALEELKLKSSSVTYNKYSATFLKANWSSSVPYKQTVSISGIKSTDSPIVDVVFGDTDQMETIKESWTKVDRIETGDGSITAYCSEEKPITDVTIQLLVLRN